MIARRIAAAAALALAVLGRPLSAEEPGYRAVDGLAVYFGIVPAEIVKGHPATHPERTMHDATPRGEHAFHAVVAAFDAATGARLENLTVDATLVAPARPPRTERLDRMTIAGKVTYGAFFALAGYGTYRFRVSIGRPGAAKPAVAEFAYEHRVK